MFLRVVDFSFSQCFSFVKTQTQIKACSLSVLVYFRHSSVPPEACVVFLSICTSSGWGDWVVCLRSVVSLSSIHCAKIQKKTFDSVTLTPQYCKIEATSITQHGSGSVQMMPQEPTPISAVSLSSRYPCVFNSGPETIRTSRMGPKGGVPLGMLFRGALIFYLQTPAQGNPAEVHLLPTGTGWRWGWRQLW